MKRILPLFLITLIFSACVDVTYNAEINDSKTKMKVIGTGLSCNDVTIEVGGEVVERNNFYQGEKVTVSFINVLGMTEIDNKIYPNLSLSVKDANGKVINSRDDLIKSETSNLSPLKLTAFFTVPFEYREGHTYHLHINIKDKKGKGVITADMPFTISPNPNIKIKSQGLSVKRVYLWDKAIDLVITNNEIQKDHTYYIIVDSLRGLTEIDDLVYPVLPMYIIDNNGDTLLASDDLLDKAEEGINPDKLLNIPFTFSVNGDVSNPVTVKTGIWDQKSERYFEINASVKAK